ncbi:MAG TPA: hypothetical protein VLF93_03865, partial [Candidatus Saccharimonadales bacterium]|nr:hypothetical protein [Candidatus Saccharimonadales bacterium]
YTFSYPTGWKESESGVPEGSGQVVYLQPPTANPSIKPHVLIKVTPATAKAVAANNEVYVILKYKKTEEEVNGTPAQKYSNVLQSEHGPLHSIAYVFQKNGNLYLVELGYTQTAADPQLENEFNQLVTSFVIEK